MFLIIIFAYCCGKGNFWPAMALIAIHVAIYCSFSTFFQTFIMKSAFTLKMVIYNVMNSLANLYCHNWIHYDLKNQNTPVRTLPPFTIMKELGSQSLLIIENIIILVITYVQIKWTSGSNLYEQTTVLWITVVMFCLHFLGIVFKFWYYFKYHIWRNLITREFKRQVRGFFTCNLEKVRNNKFITTNDAENVANDEVDNGNNGNEEEPLMSELEKYKASRVIRKWRS